jgi:hypothetical protein
MEFSVVQIVMVSEYLEYSPKDWRGQKRIGRTVEEGVWSFFSNKGTLRKLTAVLSVYKVYSILPLSFIIIGR